MIFTTNLQDGEQSPGISLRPVSPAQGTQEVQA
jgi:hypothetical protein